MEPDREEGDVSAATPGTPVRIRYRRPPDREELFVQRLVHRSRDVAVTLLDAIRLRKPMRIGGRVVLEDGSPIVWFTFPGAWHDIGRFHTADGAFVGLYANVLTPVRFVNASSWETTDLFLDVWQDPAGHTFVLDEAELGEALRYGWVDAATAARAREEAESILERARNGRWPPRVVKEWTLERALDRLSRRRPPDPGRPPPGAGDRRTPAP